MFYINIENGEINGGSEINNSRFWSDIYFQVEVEESVYNSIMAMPGKYKYNRQTGEFIENPDYEQQQAAKERARLNMLSLTKADVLLALYEDKGLTPDDIKAMLKDNVPALIKFDYASSYYRGDEVVNALGLALGYTTEEMDYLFTNKKFPTTEETSATEINEINENEE